MFDIRYRICRINIQGITKGLNMIITQNGEAKAVIQDPKGKIVPELQKLLNHIT